MTTIAHLFEFATPLPWLVLDGPEFDRAQIWSNGRDGQGIMVAETPTHQNAVLIVRAVETLARRGGLR